MFKRVLTTSAKLKPLTFRSTATFFGQQPNYDSNKDYYLTLGVSKTATES